MASQSQKTPVYYKVTVVRADKSRLTGTFYKYTEGYISENLYGNNLYKIVSSPSKGRILAQIDKGFFNRGQLSTLWVEIEHFMMSNGITRPPTPDEKEGNLSFPQSVPHNPNLNVQVIEILTAAKSSKNKKKTEKGNKKKQWIAQADKLYGVVDELLATFSCWNVPQRVSDYIDPDSFCSWPQWSIRQVCLEQWAHKYFPDHFPDATDVSHASGINYLIICQRLHNYLTMKE